METKLPDISSFWNDERIALYESAMEKVIVEIKQYDQDYYRKTQNHLVRFVEKRLKTTDSIAQKVERKKKPEGKTLEEMINDLAGVRVICFDTKQIYMLARMIGKSSQFEIIKVKDYVRKPKDNGYQSYHIILGIDGIKVELQIRTILMDAWSSLDSILVYKKTDPISEEMKANIQRFAKWGRKMDKMVTRMMKQKLEKCNCD